MRTPWFVVVLVFACAALYGAPGRAGEPESREMPVGVRGIYGGVPTELMEDGGALRDAGVNAVWIGERGITAERVEAIHAQGARLFAEFNTLHRAEYLKEHPDAAPVGPDGRVAEAPHGWQGICPTHEAYRRWRMDAFRTLLETHAVDGVWLDYHHAHASWERAEPVLPDTCFCDRCLARFQEDTGLRLDFDTTEDAAKRLLGSLRERWTTWRCAVFTDWIREFRDLRDATRPDALLGTFHCPWTDEERDGALRDKLAIDLHAQAEYVDVFSPMPYHARFGHADDPAWIARQVTWLGEHLARGPWADRDVAIWPIVQLADWGEPVPVEQVAEVIRHGAEAPATGVMVFAWGRLRRQPAKVEAMVEAFQALAARTASDDDLPLAFEPGETGRLAPRYSPKGFRVPLASVEDAPDGHDPLEGRLPLGPAAVRGAGRRLVLARSEADGPYDRLWIDLDGDDAVDDEAVRTAVPSTRRGTVYTHFDATLGIAHEADASAPREPYGIGLWVAVSDAAETPPFVRFSRRGFLVAPVEIEDEAWSVVLSDADHDAVYGEGDWWALLPADAEAVHDIGRARRVGDFAWAGTRAYRLELEGTRGRTGRLVAHDPGITPEEDTRARDPYWDDKQAKRAPEPLAFRHDVEAALEEAKTRGVACYLDFETVWCGPCKTMDRLVYTAEAVVDAAEDVVCVKVDGDERKDLKAAYGVSAFPTGILLAPGGQELARFRGYRSVQQMVAFFREAMPWIAPGSVDVVVEGATASGRSVLRLPDRFVWGGSVVRGEDGRYHMLFNTWPADPDGPVFSDGWVLRSEIGYAVSDRPDGDFVFQGIVLRGRRHDGRGEAWDAQMVTNPHLCVFDGRYRLYYVGSRDPGPRAPGSAGEKLGPRDRVQQVQRIGLIVFDSFEDLLAGRFERPDAPLLAPRTRVKSAGIVDPSPPGTAPLPDNIVVVNPSVVHDPVQDRYLLYFKGNLYDPHWRGVHGVAVAEDPGGPFRALDTFVFDVRLPDGRLASAEDPYVWYHPGRERFYAVVKDFTGAITGSTKGLALLSSEDGIDWTPARHALFSRNVLVTGDGMEVPVARLERPQLLVAEDGAPRVLYAACALEPCNHKRDGSTFNVQIPLRVRDVHGAEEGGER